MPRGRVKGVCGLTGEVRLDGRVPDVAAVAAMAAVMAPRGPDAAGAWSQGRVALGHRLRAGLGQVNDLKATVTERDPAL